MTGSHRREAHPSPEKLRLGISWAPPAVVLRQAQTSLCFALRPVEPETSVLHVHWGERAFDQLFVSECWGLNSWFALFLLSKPVFSRLVTVAPASV